MKEEERTLSNHSFLKKHNEKREKNIATHFTHKKKTSFRMSEVWLFFELVGGSEEDEKVWAAFDPKTFSHDWVRASKLLLEGDEAGLQSSSKSLRYFGKYPRSERLGSIAGYDVILRGGCQDWRLHELLHLRRAFVSIMQPKLSAAKIHFRIRLR